MENFRNNTLLSFNFEEAAMVTSTTEAATIGRSLLFAVDEDGTNHCCQRYIVAKITTETVLITKVPSPGTTDAPVELKR